MQNHRDNPAALRPHHKRILGATKVMYILPAQGFLSWAAKNLDGRYDAKNEEQEMLRRAERAAHPAMSGSYSHFYKTPPASPTQAQSPLDTPHAKLAVTWTKAIPNAAQSLAPIQETPIGSLHFLPDAEPCAIKVTAPTCFTIPYSL